jgi:hypothetical protein
MPKRSGHAGPEPLGERGPVVRGERELDAQEERSPRWIGRVLVRADDVAAGLEDES